MLEDDFGRTVTGIRVSLTDRCNFDCVYCHNEGLGDTRGPMEPADDEMTADEVVRVLEVASEFGIDSVKFTGGEPMLREDLEEIIERTPDDMEVSMTTNGTFLPGRAEGLVEAGLERVNVSQDALDPEDFAAVTKSGAYERVLEGVDAALDAGLDPVKLNMVVFEHTKGYVADMVDHVARNDGLQLQLIEYMPELAGRPEWNVDIQRVHDWLAGIADRVEHREMHDRRRYWIDAGAAIEEGAASETSATSAAAADGGTASDPSWDTAPDSTGGTSPDSSGGTGPDSSGGMVEIVDPVENPSFCANCGRVRVTHEGYLKGCLNRNDDLRSMGEMTKPEIREAFREVVSNRVPYYGEYLVRNDEGEWELNEEYLA